MISRTFFIAFVLLCSGCGKQSLPEAGPSASRPELFFDKATGDLVRRDTKEHVMWSVKVDGAVERRWPPHLLSDDDRVYVTTTTGATALDGKTGKVIWDSPGPADRMCLSEDLLLAADCTHSDVIADGKRWLLARKIIKGTVVFRVELPLKDFYTTPIREIGGFFLVQRDENANGDSLALLVDRDGKVRGRFDRKIVDGKRLQESDFVFLTSRDIVRYSSEKKLIWVTPFRNKQWSAGGGLVSLPEDGLIGFIYGEISDSGVEVIRLDPSTGKVLWHVTCAPLGVTHSKYKHQVTVEIEGTKIRVTSKGSSGNFVELLDLTSGKQLDRRVTEKK